ncbi:hypothetical protein MNBD_IGNAVI01-2408 [hydrothermal vent metagenome]|uniref:N-acetylmuramoyl-L-alanine amidase n=1 Tax=hydrothermal vent metagenome TaxID=652676 RepID=A0A3B1CG88_9ZZZZ
MKILSLQLILIFLFTGWINGQEGKIPVKELNYPKDLKVIKRSQWGWVPLTKKKKEAKITKITIHHGGVKFTKDEDPKEALRELQKWSREEKGWIDIPYHFVIDLDGNIYEARPINYPGDTNTEYDPTGHALIEVMGNYEVQTLSKKQLDSLINLIAFLAKKFNVPVSEIKTHRDYSKMTVCPGKNIYKYFQDSTIVKAVENKLKK